MLRRQRAIEIVPRSKPLRWRRYDVPEHLAPETSDALRFCAVEGDLDLLDRRHRSTIEAPEIDDEGREIWLYVCSPDEDQPVARAGATGRSCEGMPDHPVAAGCST